MATSMAMLMAFSSRFHKPSKSWNEMYQMSPLNLNLFLQDFSGSILEHQKKS